MAIVTRYFSTTSAGDRDGTTWANRAALFVSTIAVNSATWSGALSPGETVTQTGTGATAVVELAGGSGNIMAVSNVTGSPNNSGVWTGGTSGKTVTPTATPLASRWSPVITRFNFAGSDSLEARIQGGLTYSCGAGLSTSLFTNAPTATNILIVIGCDANGDILQIPNPGWVSSQGTFSTTAFPVIATSFNTDTINLSNSWWRLVEFTASNVLQAMCYGGNYTWCSFINNTSNSDTTVLSGPSSLYSSQITMSGSSFNSAITHTGSSISNVRIDASAATLGGTRIGIITPSSNNQTHEQLTIIGCAGGGYFAATGATTRWGAIKKSLIINCGTFGFRGNPIASQTAWHFIYDSIIINSVIGIDGQSAARLLISNCRLRNNTTANFSGIGNYPDYYSIDISSGADADEFVNPSIGDYRIKRTSSLWGRGLGPGDEPTPAQAYLLLART